MEAVDMEQYERALTGGATPFCGVDEAGRGPLAGPVCAAAVILPEEPRIPELNDSKKLSPRKREELFEVICQQAISFAVAFASVQEIEEHNIKNAAYLAMDRAVLALDPVPALALVDGSDSNQLGVPSRKIVRGDGLCASIAAASILAKVTRDRYMLVLDEQYPGYGFARHKGYGTRAHYEAIRRLGPCPAHRPAFLRKMH